MQSLLNIATSNLYTFFDFSWVRVLRNSSFLTLFYPRSENIWNDGFLFDFLQKKTVDAWIRQYVIYTGFLFSERVVFEAVVRLYNDILIWPSHSSSIFESSNTSSMLSSVLFLYFSLYIILILLISVLLA
jgi:hypothetical protein